MSGAASTALGAALHPATPPDDAGAETLDRYEWQAMMATADLLALYLEVLDQGMDPSAAIDRGLVCEYHEDWVRIRPGQVQLVSAKHKDPQFGAFTTTASLLTVGGVYHLFDRWHELGGSLEARLVTTAGLAADAGHILDLCGTSDSPPADTAAHRAYTRLIQGVADRRKSDGHPEIDDLPATISRFINRLTLDHGLPRREHVPDFAPTGYAEPIAKAIGQPQHAAAVWEAVLSLVRGRMRAAGPRRRGLLPTLDPSTTPDLERRTITVADAHIAMSFAVSSPAAFMPLPRVTVTNRLAVKMSEGRCAATSIERAEALRRQFASWRREQRSQPGARVAEVELLLLRVADHATAAVRTSTGHWGAALWAELEDRLTREAGTGPVASIDSDMLLGGVSYLTNACKVWYSEPFDAADRLRQLTEDRL
ncbi:hypothetical protein ACGIF2_15695 [Cellulomonas sp. P22]|uniref:hypothetical protein n=1 Tax=Cellulomonas sp. P22 TaxID=3373189 RepID=UPI0037B1F828